MEIRFTISSSLNEWFILRLQNGKALLNQFERVGLESFIDGIPPIPTTSTCHCHMPFIIWDCCSLIHLMACLILRKTSINFFYKQTILTISSSPNMHLDIYRWHFLSFQLTFGIVRNREMISSKCSTPFTKSRTFFFRFEVTFNFLAFFGSY